MLSVCSVITEYFSLKGMETSSYESIAEKLKDLKERNTSFQKENHILSL